MDGVDQLNNILIIGMTNRKDMIDEALLRPGKALYLLPRDVDSANDTAPAAHNRSSRGSYGNWITG